MWSAEEEDVLKKFYPDRGLKYCAQFLPKRSLGAIEKKVKSMGLRVSHRRRHAPKNELIAFISSGNPYTGNNDMLLAVCRPWR
jgi:hypothetical protein